jgi:hypothetical protein
MRGPLSSLLVLALAMSAFPAVVSAEPQFSSVLSVGGAAVGKGAPDDHAEFLLGLRGDVLFGRSDAGDFGFGPFVNVKTFAFDQVQFGGGLSTLFPVHESLPLVASLGAYGRYGDDPFGVEPGVQTSVFWGSRSYNFHANYVMSGGILLGYRQAFGSSRESVLEAALQLDLMVLALPVIALVNWIKGPTPPARSRKR